MLLGRLEWRDLWQVGGLHMIGFLYCWMGVRNQEMKNGEIIFCCGRTLWCVENLPCENILSSLIEIKKKEDVYCTLPLPPSTHPSSQPLDSQTHFIAIQPHTGLFSTCLQYPTLSARAVLWFSRSKSCSRRPWWSLILSYFYRPSEYCW